MATLAELLRQKADSLINLPAEAQRFITNPQAFTELFGANQLPKETGFAAGAVGVPPKNIAGGGVLNPLNYQYAEGYESGEPIGIASSCELKTCFLLHAAIFVPCLLKPIL